MDIPTMMVSRYVKDMGINLTALSQKSGIEYFKLYNSLANESGRRALRAGEFMTLCYCLEVDPMRFAEEPDQTVG